MNIKFPTLHSIYVDHMHRNAGFAMAEDHFHPYFELYFVRSGKCCFFLNNTVHSLSAGDIMLIAPGDLHHTLYLQDEDCDRITLYFGKEHILPALTDYAADFSEVFLHSHPILIHPSFHESIATLLEHMLSEYHLNDEHSPSLLSVYLHQLFCLLLRHRIDISADLALSYEKDAGVLSAAKYIYEHFSAPLTLEKVASIAGLSPTYFSKKFKQITGIGFKEYVNFVRMKNATVELMTTDNSITDIALNNGFTDGNYFKDSFKKIHGCSPREYRKQGK